MALSNTETGNEMQTPQARRSFLKLAGLGMASLATSALLPGRGLFAQDAERAETEEEAVEEGDKQKKPSLVVIYLRGGIDALNALIPFNDPNYKTLRPTIAIPTEDSEEAGKGMIKLDKNWGAHPSFDALKPWYDKKKVVFIAGAGSTHTTRSHFDAQDFMEYAAPGNRNIRSGWLNRFLEDTKKRKEDDAKQHEQVLRALAMQGLLPRSLRGDYPVLAVPDKDVLENDEVVDLFKELYGDGSDEKKSESKGMGESTGDGAGKSDSGMGDSGMGDKDGFQDGANGKDMPAKGAESGMKERNTGDPAEREDPVVETGRDTIKTLERFKEIMKREVKGTRAKYPEGRLGQRMRAIATILRTGEPLEVAALDVGGWDTHATQGGSEGTFANNVKSVADSIAAFMEDIGDRLDNTMVLVMSEFGRTCRENGNNGTDHGHGCFMLACGGKIKGGKVCGEVPSLATKDLYQGRDLQVTTDFRDVFYTVLRKHMRYSVPKDFFPDYDKPSLIKGMY